MALYDMNPLDEEEERKRREAIAQRMDEEAYANPVGPVNPSFMDRVGTAVGNRFDQAMDRVSNAGNAIMNPAEALQQRMINDQRQEQADEAANTEVKTQTVKTYGDGSQEQVVKTQIPAGQAQEQKQQAPMAGMPQMSGPVAPNSPEAQQQAQQFAQAMAQAQRPEPKLTTPIPGMPDNLPAQGAISPQQAQQAPVMAKLPQPGPAVQVAGAPQMPAQAAAPGASLAQAGAQAQARPTTPVVTAPAPAPWIQAANEAGTDFYKLLDVANKNPESRDMIAEKIKSSFKQQTMKDEADAIMAKAQTGDLQAQNKILQSIKPEKGKAKEEVTVTDYLAAVLYKRLGLDALAQQKQMKILGKETTFEQVTLGGSNWQVEKDSSGNIIRAKDNEGTIATTDTLNKLRAGAQKFGTQATSFAGGLHTVPNAAGDGQDLVMPAANSIDPTKSGFVYMSGPKQGQMYSGTATPQPQSIGTSLAKAVDKALVDFKTSPSIAGAKAAMDKAYVLDPGDGSLIRATQAQINANSPEIFSQIKTYSPSGNVTERLPVEGGAKPDEIARAQRDIESIEREMKQKPAGFSNQAESQRKAILQKELDDRKAFLAKNGVGTTAQPAAGTSLAQREANVAINKTLVEAEEKEPATARGKGKAQDINNQRSADENYGLIQPVADLIKKSTGSGIGAGVDTLARLFGIGTPGAQAIAQLNTMSYPFKYMIPRFEGPQSDKDTNLYVEAAGDFANPKKSPAERLASLQGMIFILKKYDKEGKNDWSFGGTNPAEQGKPQMTEQQKAQAELERRKKK